MDLVDSKALQALEPRSLVEALQLALLYILDQIPGDAEMASDVLNCHDVRKTENVALELASVAAPWLGEADPRSANSAAFVALKLGDEEIEEDRFAADRKGTKRALDLATSADVRRATGRATELAGGASEGKAYGALEERDALLAVATKAESMVEKACGHRWILLR